MPHLKFKEKVYAVTVGTLGLLASAWVVYRIETLDSRVINYAENVPRISKLKKTLNSLIDRVENLQRENKKLLDRVDFVLSRTHDRITKSEHNRDKDKIDDAIQRILKRLRDVERKNI